MPAYQRQHFLPAAYLKYFSIDQANCNRKSHVWRFDGKSQSRVPIVSQCFGDYHYSRDKAEETEKHFHPSESLYCACVDKIRSNKLPAETDYGNLLIVMFDLYIRNNIHQNQTGKEGVEAYRLRNRVFAHQILLGKTDELATKKELVAFIGRNWSMNILSPPANHQFFASDNPSVWITLRKINPGVHLVTLPLTPNKIAVAFDKRVVEEIGNTVTGEDMMTIKCAQIENADKCVFSSQEFIPEEMDFISPHLNQKSESPCAVSDTTWKLSLKKILPEHMFSFVRQKPPIL